MAEAVFEDGDEHPIEAYLRETALDDGALVPGSLDAFQRDDDPLRDDHLPARLVQSALRLLHPLMPVHTPASTTAQRELAERLKYLIISSSLLSASLATHAQRRSSGWRTPSLPAPLLGPPTADSKRPEHARAWSPLEVAVVAAGPLAVMAGHFGLGIAFALLYAITLSISRTHHPRSSRPPSHLLQTIASVEALIAAGTHWDSVVHAGFAVLDKEERSIASSPTAADAQVSLRVTLNSTLTTTQLQCDNIRSLFSPLTSPAALSQLSEMYAPPATKPSVLSLSTLASRPMSPDFPRLYHLSSGRSQARRLSSQSYESLSHARGQSMSATMTRANRASWYGGSPSAGSLSSAHMSGVSTMPHSPLSRKDRRRSALPSLFVGSQPVRRERELDSAETSSLPSASPRTDDLFYRPTDTLTRRHSARAGLSPSSHRFMNESISEHPHHAHVPLAPAPLLSPGPIPRTQNRQPSPSPSPSSSRFTTIPRSTPTSSLAGLRSTLDATLASRRYTAAHLLALRFDGDPEEEEDDFILVPEERDDAAYWEDVRSVVDLMTSALEDASLRMVEALEESEREAALVAQPSPVASSITDLPAEPPSAVSFADRLLFPPGLHPAPGDSFAPGPSNLARLAGHMDSIVESVGHVKEHLSELADAIRAYQQAQLGADEDMPTSGVYGTPDALRSRALTVYERMRSEIGMSLRECERSRGPLQNALWPPASASASSSSGGRRSFEDAPELTNSEGSASSCDSHDSPGPLRPHSLLSAPELELPGFADGRSDDATAHLLRDTSAAHLPPPGIEQVFEAASSPTTEISGANRERSKLSRSERIELVKARRERDSVKRQSLIAALGFGVEGIPTSPTESVDREARDAWGPGTEVVQELKDAIWRVGERKRRMADGQTPATSPVVATTPARSILESRWSPPPADS
ncbi:hypothetical protein AURDEDRAFT_183502 [Auricularia subglabra TFB-10046 SS5]|nr:hypothetical protein AURDEDRAFT_183502 [Auricularia subglabra TFB-10046 SS5]